MSADQYDLDKGWTVQSGGKKPPAYDQTILHTVTRDQLPDPDIQRAAQIDPDEWAALGLVIVDEPVVAEPKHSKGTK